MTTKSRWSEVEAHIATASLILLVVITLGNVLTRYFTDQSFAWTEEISVFLMALMCFAGTASVATRDQHIRIEFLYESGSDLRQVRFKQFSACLCTVFFALLTFLFVLSVRDEIKYGETTMGLNWPRWWFSIWLPILCGFISLRCLLFAASVSKPTS